MGQPRLNIKVRSGHTAKEGKLWALIRDAVITTPFTSAIMCQCFYSAIEVEKESWEFAPRICLHNYMMPTMQE